MRYDRQYGQGRGQRPSRRGRDVDYGWGVPVRGMYDYSLDYGGLSGPETEDSESIPPYESGPGDWTAPTARQPRYESHHWAAAEPAGESRYRDEQRGRGRYARDFTSFRSALEAARARARSGYASDYDREYERAFGARGGAWGRSLQGGRPEGWAPSRGGGRGRTGAGAGPAEQRDTFQGGSPRGGARRGGGYGGEYLDRPRGRGSSFGPGRGFGGGGQGGAARVPGGWAALPGGGRTGYERPDRGMGMYRGDEWLRERSAGGYGRQYHDWPGSRSGWRGAPGMSSGEGAPGGGAGRERGFGWPRQGAPYEPERDYALRESRGRRGRWGRVAPRRD